MAARQVQDPLLRFGGEDDPATIDPTISEHVVGGDAIEAAELGLRNIDRVAQLLIPATTALGETYQGLAFQYGALVTQRHRELVHVAKLVGGVVEQRFGAGRDGMPFTPVRPARQREAVRFLIDHAFKPPEALLDPQILDRIAPTAASDLLQGSNVDLLRRLTVPGVFARMAEASERGQGSYLGADLLTDLNRGLFVELKSAAPAVTLYRRNLQREYVMQLLAGAGAIKDPADSDDASAEDSTDARPPPHRKPQQSNPGASELEELAKQTRAAPGAPNEFRAAVVAGISALSKDIEKALPKVRDAATAVHLRDLAARLSQ
jgi:hypothetical protein